MTNRPALIPILILILILTFTQSNHITLLYIILSWRGPDHPEILVITGLSNGSAITIYTHR